MTWKSYVAVSGATVFAGWLASVPPAAVPEGGPAIQVLPSSQVVPGVSSDIEVQASRLQARIRREMAYTRPQRNPFQFEAEPAVPPVLGELGQSGPPAEVPVPVAAPRPFVTLAGVATDLVQQGVDRTAILSSPAGVLLVRAGDEVLGHYQVGIVEDESVELISLVDGSTVRLSFGRPTAR